MPLPAPAVGATHDLRNVLFVISAHCHRLLQAASPDADGLDDLHAIRDATERGMALARDILSNAAAAEPPRPIDVNTVVRGIIPLLQRLVGDGIEIAVRLADVTWPVQITPTQLEQVVMNLVVNARDAMPRGGRITIGTENRTSTASVAATPMQVVVLSVTDTGIGMAPDLQARIFEPYFTTKAQAGGTGIGLATVRTIALLGGGHIEVSSRPGEGTTMRVVLPRAAAVADERPAVDVEPQDAVVPASRQVLIVEDESSIRDMLHRWLALQGYDLLVARNGSEALDLCAGRPRPVDLLLTDVNLPDMRGAVIARRLQARSPELRVVYMSGETEALEQIRRTVAAPVLTKPFSMAELARAFEVAWQADATSAYPRALP